MAAPTPLLPHLPLVPAPRAWEPTSGVWHPEVLVGVAVAAGTDPAWAALDNAAATWLDLTPVAADAGTPGLRIVRAEGFAPEGYRLALTPTGCELTAGTPAGAFRGLMSLTQLVRKAPPGGLPCGVITDEPLHPWRGLLLDCGRHFMPVPVVESVIDALALHRGNVLHWHLTEDQGWRVEVPGLPELTAVGAWREGPDGARTGGYYTTAQMREIVAYAAARHVTVVPEIEMPGHAKAALAAYPELSCTGGPFAVETQWGIHEDIFCAGNEALFAFLEQVLTHVLDVFPSEFIHVGGDEAPRDRWRACPRCQARIRQEGLADESALQAWFIGRIESWLAARGRRLVGWDEILEGGLLAQSPGATVQSWRGFRGATAAATAGHDAIVSPTSHAYFDYDPGVLDLQQVHAFSPVPPGLDDEVRAHILGGEMNLWTEYVPPERVPTLLAPRLAAMAEALWTGTADGGFPAFLDRLAGHDAVWRSLGWTPGAAARPVRLEARYDAGEGGFRFAWSVDPRLREVFDDADLVVRTRRIPLAARPTWRPDVPPEEQGPAFVTADDPAAAPDGFLAARPGEAPLLVCGRLFIAGRPYGAPTVLELDPHRALGAAPTWSRPASARYPGGAAGWPVDGRRGGIHHDDGRWAGFEGVDMEVVLDLGRTVRADSVGLRALQDANAWIFLPTDVRFAWSADGRTWTEAPAVTHDVLHREQRKLIHGFAVPVGADVRWVKVHANNRRTCPPWHPGRGRPCWIFVDEVTVR